MGKSIEDKQFYCIKYNQISHKITTTIENTQINEGDILFFKHTDNKNGYIVDYLARSNSQGYFTNTCKQMKLQKNLKFVIMLDNLRSITPATLSQNRMIAMDSNSSEDNYFTEIVLMELTSWDEN